MDVNAKDIIFYYTALHMAARYRHKAVARLLVKKGADINNKGTVEVTLLH